MADKNRKALRSFLETATYQQAAETLRDVLRRQLIAVLGGDWEKIHNEYGMYTINCRIKSTRRILEKYDALKKRGIDVTVENFFQLIPDLAAGRLVVVDPADLFGLAERVREGCVPPLFESPDDPHQRSRVRHGKFAMYDTARFREAQYHIAEEQTGYCSVHFIFRPGTDFYRTECNSEQTAPLRRLDDSGKIPLHAWHLEVQVRTIMDEAWGETDHFVRYENPRLRDDVELKGQFAALAGYLQAANHHVSLIRETARRKGAKRNV